MLDDNVLIGGNSSNEEKASKGGLHYADLILSKHGQTIPWTTGSTT